jgi:uncharacterized protein GlcG (DUF336 family)
MTPTLKVETLSLEAAKVAVEACEAKAKSMGIPMNIAVVDSSTHLLHFSRMDGAKITSISIAQDKAFTAGTIPCDFLEIKSQYSPSEISWPSNRNASLQGSSMAWRTSLWHME